MIEVQIEDLKTQYAGEWLLIEVTRVEEKTSAPLAGRLIAHEKSRQAIRQKLLTCPGSRLAMIYTGPVLPRGFAAALRVS